MQFFLFFLKKPAGSFKKKRLQDSVVAWVPHASFALPCSHLGTGLLSSWWQSAALGCKGRWGDPPSVHPAPLSRSRPKTGMAAGSAETYCERKTNFTWWKRNHGPQVSFGRFHNMCQCYKMKMSFLPNISFWDSRANKSNWFNNKEMWVCHIPFLFLPVPLLTWRRAKVLPFLQLLSCRL